MGRLVLTYNDIGWKEAQPRRNPDVSSPRLIGYTYLLSIVKCSAVHSTSKPYALLPLSYYRFPFGYAVANEVCRPWAVFQSHFCYGWETVALYSSGILRHLLSWRWGSPFTSYTYTSGFFRAGRPGVSRRPARWVFYFTQRKNKK